MIERTPDQPGPSFAQYRTHGWQPAGFAGDSRGWQGAGLWIALTAATAVVGALASPRADVFYAALTQPVWAPPAWLFGPVWTVLYALMAAAAILVHRRVTSPPQGWGALRLYALALIPNALWSWTFFRWHLGAVALAVNVVLWGLLLATFFAFRRVRAVSAALMLPVLLWVSFAVALNAALLVLNPTLL